MSRRKIISMLAVALVAIAASMPAFAHHGHHHHHGHWRVNIGFGFGGPAFYYPYPRYYYPPYYYPPYPYYPPVVTVPAAPVYIERGDSYAPSAQTPPSAQTQGYWHYCPEAKAYYPYVKQCPGGWQKHTPTPPPGG